MTSTPVANLGLCEFARANRGSARLRNSLEAARLDNRLPFRTVGDYLAASAPVHVLCAEVRSLGRRTALELDRMVREIVSFPGPSSSGDAPEAATVQAALVDVRRTLATLPLRSLLDGLPCHGRLALILEAPVGARPVLPAIDDPEVLRAEALRIPGVGAQKLADLVAEVRLGVSRLVREAGYAPAMHDALLTAIYGGHGGPAWREQAGLEDDGAQGTRELLFDLVGDVPCGSEFALELASVRLVRLLQLQEIGGTPLADALLDRGRFAAELMRVPNAGRKTVVEFWEVCWRRLAVALSCRGVSPEERDALAASLGVERALLDPRPDDLIGRATPPAGAVERPEVVVVPGDLDGLLAFVLERIKPQDATVVRRRFGLDGGRGETLEEVGADVGVTRERIRQIESRGLKHLRTQCRRVDLGAALDAEWARAWGALADGDDLITDQEFTTFRRTVPGAINLGLELLDLELAAWLSRVSRRYPHGWLAPTRDGGPVDEAIAALEALPDNRPLPRAVRELNLPGSPLDIEAALLVGRGHRVLHGYLVDGRIGTRRRRSLVAHAVLSRARGPMPLTDLLRAYHEAAPADWCSSRDLTIVMSDAPHLFLEVSEGCWFAVGAGGEIPAGGRRREVDVADEESAEQDTVASAIRDELERTGPQALAALTENPWRYLPRDRSRNSVQPTLFTRPDLFARLLPGVYGLWSQVPTRDEVLTDDVPCLFDATQARIFAMARRAGEPWGAFPLWSPEAEYRLCRWAMREAAPEVRRSLLATATIDIWPLSADERSRWLDVRAREGRYDLLATVRPAVFAVRPDLDRVLAALVALDANGRTSWMALNRIDGRHVVSQVSCALLATLVLCGALIPPDDAEECAWQLSHGARRAVVRELRDELAAELHECGELVWSSPAGRLVAARVLEGRDRAPGWLPFRRFSELFRGLDADPAMPTEVTVDTAGEVGRALLAERRMADLLDWLDAQ